jgi:hypothetical protein
MTRRRSDEESRVTNTRQNHQQVGTTPHAGKGTESDGDRRRRRARFLRELAEARELQQRVAPHRSKVARMRWAVRMRTFRT